MSCFRSLSLGQTFSWILAGASSAALGGCDFSTGQCGPAGQVEFELGVAPSTLRPLLGDGVLDGEDCAALCSDGGQYHVESGCRFDYDAEAFEMSDNGERQTSDGGGAGGADGAAGGSGDAGAQATGGPSTATVEGTCSFMGGEICEGRRHASWGDVKPALERSARGRWFARAAANEAASVHSFRCLSRELRSTPLGHLFSGRLRRAARQEVRHARLMRARARSHGAEVVGRSFHAPAERALIDIALENAREGCVNETYAALVALHQSAHALDAELRDEFLEIALDETAHADLAWRMHEALLFELQPSEATAVQTALRDALDALHNTPQGTVLALAERRHLGLASPEVDHHLRHELVLALQDRAGRLGFSAG